LSSISKISKIIDRLRINSIKHFSYLILKMLDDHIPVGVILRKIKYHSSPVLDAFVMGEASPVLKSLVTR
jgi:hypothetical protein